MRSRQDRSSWNRPRAWLLLRSLRRHAIVTQEVREMRLLGIVEGYRCSRSSIVVPDGSAAPAQQSMTCDTAPQKC